MTEQQTPRTLEDQETPRTREGALQALRTMGFTEDGPDPRPTACQYKDEAFAYASGGRLLAMCRANPAGPRRWIAQVQLCGTFHINMSGDAQGVLTSVFEGEAAPEVAIADALLGLQVKLAEWTKALAPFAV